MLGGEAALRFTADNFVATEQNQDAFAAAKQFDCKESNLYLHGPCGVGKTHLGCMVARTALERGERAEYVQPGRLLRSIRGKTGDEEQSAIDRLASLDVLVFDDLGAEKDSEYAVQILYEVIDGRVMNCRNGLIVTSNLPLSDLAVKLGDDRLPSRLAGLCTVIPVGGRDWRMSR
jgi:DNA replication protein DnaC